MEDKYLYESFSAESGAFDRDFSGYLNRMRADGWKVKNCSVCHSEGGGKITSSCLFKKHH
jgi:hypothetical protein